MYLNIRFSNTTFESFVIRHSSFVIRHSSFVIRHSSFVIRHSSFVIRHSLDSAALRGTAAVVWNRSDVPDRFHFDARSLQSTYGRFTARSRPFDLDLYASHAHLLCRRGRFRSGLLRGKGSSLARSLEPHGAGATMRDEISFQVRYADNGVVEGRQDVGDARRHVDLLPLLSRLLLHSLFGFFRFIRHAELLSLQFF